ncbi:MAG: HhoA/HhoB/HtrA family serine endopeptidase [Microcoleaceae cyanobacterium]
MNRKNRHRNGGQFVTYLLLILAGVATTFFGQKIFASRFPSHSPTAIASATSPATATTQQGDRPIMGEKNWLNFNTRQTPDNFVVSVVEKVGPAVVRINASRESKRSEKKSNMPDDFFGFDDPSFNNEDPVEEGTGSGFIISADGHILTNSHVVENSDTVQVILKNGNHYAGKVLGVDPITDVAVVKIPTDNLPAVILGDSQNLKPGQWAIAIGNPLGLDNSVTVGIISATGRSSSDVGVPDKRVGFIQTDAAINPGNSGGPLLNEMGEVIGMNTAIISGAQGLGFAIPIHSAKKIAEELISTGKVEHAYLGIAMQTLTPEIKQAVNKNLPEKLNIKVDQGVLIVNVMPRSPATKAGLQAGDVILRMNGQAVNKSENVQEIVQAQSVGDVLQLEVNRNGKLLKVPVQMSILPAERNPS